MSVIEPQNHSSVAEFPDSTSPPFGETRACVDVSEQDEGVSFGNVEDIRWEIRVVYVIGEVDLQGPRESGTVC
jgi:hypothetical protein